MLIFQVEGNIAKLQTICEGCRVTVTIEHQNGEKITKEDAEIVFTEAMKFAPQRIRHR